MINKKKPKDYDEEPVTYCAKCYSLRIVFEDIIGVDCCGECGCSDLLTSSIEDWEKLYTRRYGHKYMENKRDIKNSPIFQLSIDKLKTMVYDHPQWRELCKALYPSFPEGLGKADSVILLFAKLYQESRLDDLRMELVNMNNK